MKPKKFKESTKVLQRPSTMSDDECSALPVYCDGNQCVSCWKPSFKERLLILIFGRVWLGVLSGKTQLPVFVSGESVFVKPPFKARFLTFISDMKQVIVNAFKSVKEAFGKTDKRNHFLAGFAISYFIGFLLPWLGLAIAGLVGGMKECWDLKGNNTAEWLGFIFTCLGALCAYPFACIIHALIF